MLSDACVFNSAIMMFIGLWFGFDMFGEKAVDRLVTR